jgi:hypothetical protein
MKKNVILWIGVKNPEHNDKYGDFEYFKYSKNTWKFFCEKYDCEFVEFHEVEEDMMKHRINWQKAIHGYEEVTAHFANKYKGEIHPAQIALVDSTCMASWQCPNFFELTDHKFTGWRDTDNLRWINDSIKGYEEFFDYKLDSTKYINSGFIIFSEEHYKFFESFSKMYYDNLDTLIDLQENIVKKGNEQTPLNYWLQMKNVEVKTDLPLPFKLTHLERKQLFNYNWQLNEDKTPFFIKYGYNWIFNGIPKDQRSQIMKQVWDMVKHNYSINVLDRVNHKDTYKNSTTRKFKQNILDYFTDKDIKLAVEFGCCHGDTTKVLGKIADKVFASDISNSNVEISKIKCGDDQNINIDVKDVNTEWIYDTPDVIYMDALHDYNGMLRCVTRIQEQYPESIVIMDDYGHEMNTIKPIIDNLIAADKITVLEWIGEGPGFLTANGKTFIGKEGLIFKFNKGYMKYINAESHEEYVKSQTETNKRKLNSIWVTNDEIDKIVGYMNNFSIDVNNGVCHGVRNGYEVTKFNEAFNNNIFGTEISDTATQFENVIEWDFHEIKDEWVNHFDFIYSNSIDHSYNFTRCLAQWMKTLKTTGRCFLEWNDDIEAPHNISDCFGISKEGLIELVNAKYEVESVFNVEGGHNRVILAIKHKV